MVTFALVLLSLSSSPFPLSPLSPVSSPSSLSHPPIFALALGPRYESYAVEILIVESRQNRGETAADAAVAEEEAPVAEEEAAKRQKKRIPIFRL